MKKVISILLILSMLLGMTACGNKTEEAVGQKSELITTEGAYPIDWHGEKLYANIDAWMSDYDKIIDYPDTFKQFRGKLGTADGLYGYISALYNDEFRSIYDKLAVYAYYGIYSFAGNSDYQRCIAKCEQFEQIFNNATAYFDEEMARLSLDQRKALFSDERLKPYAYSFRKYLLEDTILLSEEETLIKNQLDISRSRMETLYSLLAYTDLSDLEFKLPNGKTAMLNDSSLLTYLYGDYDIKTKLAMYDAWWGHTAELKNSFAYALETEMLEEYADAQFAGYDNTLEYVLSDEDIPYDVMDMILQAAHEGSNKHADYFKIYADRDGTDNYYPFTEYNPISNFEVDTVQYDDAVNMVIESLGILGDEYTSTFKDIISSGFVDVYPKEGKSGGAFEEDGCIGIKPFILFNYDGSFDSVATIAHEMGHACYSEFSMENQDRQNCDPDIFTQEVASTTNELLFYNYLINNAKSDEEKLFYIENVLTTWTGTFFRQCFFQEFENYCHEQVESGNILDPDEMAVKWEELSKIYYGEKYSTGDNGAYRWTTLDHLYYNHYVFKYATSICYASAIAQRIINGEEGATENYLAFLKAGNTASPAELLKIARVDIESKETYDNGLNYFYGLMDEFERLANK